jgi:hypothetical protein
MYSGEDRNRQVNALYQLANDLASAITTDVKTAYPTVAALADALANDWRDNPESDVPAWYDEHDHRLLVERLAKVL